ncbi:P-loop containing nucleoside triphosphate hydrolase protein [Rhodofomes roseus]|uniref:P-loop containing nucleoside triphosphate hydrolase protein n=1 Tax=Rhodofomes roseus TaxID=34475 RepID=A0ABQ8JX57_9APHY|nr:P-loop containing nucleoside triphosphate hydrolase protein [Rhodofomes roseus]KAH9828650.1 P-loop containing nucleoside triphosphate hydrolase protein [Rhodofomes roseus]
MPTLPAIKDSGADHNRDHDRRAEACAPAPGREPPVSTSSASSQTSASTPASASSPRSTIPPATTSAQQRARSRTIETQRVGSGLASPGSLGLPRILGVERLTLPGLPDHGLGASYTIYALTIVIQVSTLNTVLFPAAFPDHVRNFVSKLAPNAHKIKLKKNGITVDSIHQFYLDRKSGEHKYTVLTQFYELPTVGHSIIFCQHRHTADQITQRMMAQGHRATSLHSAKDTAERDTIIDSFREGREKVLITTSVIARGVNILQVEHGC